MKKAITTFFAAVMCISMTVSAMAADSVTIQQPYDGMRDLYTIRGIQDTSTVTVGEDFYSETGCLAMPVIWFLSTNVTRLLKNLLRVILVRINNAFIRFRCRF